MKLTDDEIGTLCAEAMKTSLGGPDSDVSRERLRNLEAYNAQPVGEYSPPEIEDRSTFVATDVADTIEWMLPQFMRFFVASDKAVEFKAKRPDAEPVAALCTAYINHLFYTRNDGVGVMYDWFKDALLQKVGTVKVWAEDEAEDDRQRFEGQSIETLVQLTQEGWELEGDVEEDDDGAIAFTVIKQTNSTAIKVETCSPDSIRVDSNARWGGEPAMVAHVFRRRKFELIAEGYDLEDLGTGTGVELTDALVIEQLGRGMDWGQQAPPHESHALYTCAEMYIKLDRDGDGVAEWLKVNLIEDRLARFKDGSSAIDHVDGHPFVFICPVPRPHAFFGDCPADFALQPQKLRTNVVRAIQDNLYLTVNQRTYLNMDADINIDDALDNRPGGFIRGRGNASEAMQPIVQPTLTAPAYQFNEWLESWKENRTGFTRYSQGTDANALNKTATGVSIITQKSDMRIELMARFFGVGVKQMFAKMLKLAIQHQNQTEMMEVSGEGWVQVNPSEWRDQFHVQINVGLGTGSKEQQSARVMALMQTQMQAAQFGIITPQNIANTVKLFVEANEFAQPERFVSPEPTGMPPNPQAYQQEKQGVEQQLQQLQAQIEQLTQENQGMKSQQGQDQIGQEFQAQKLALDSRKVDIDAAKVTIDAARADSDHQARMVDQQARMITSANVVDSGAGVEALQSQVEHLTELVQLLAQLVVPGETINVDSE